MSLSLLYVEGRDDWHVVRELTKHHGVSWGKDWKDWNNNQPPVPRPTQLNGVGNLRDRLSDGLRATADKHGSRIGLVLSPAPIRTGRRQRLRPFRLKRGRPPLVRRI